MTDIERTELIPLSIARQRLIPANARGKRINPSTVWRWIRKGLEGLDGQRIRLEITYRGTTPFVTAQALDRFFDQVTAARLARIRRIEDCRSDVTDAELAAAGLISRDGGDA